jgi:hypothetical protein
MPATPAHPEGAVNGSVAVTLAIAGSDEDPRWTADVRSGSTWHYCCQGGHASPEGAAAHGATQAALLLSQWARSLRPPACGALALQKAAP